ncbi:MAG TPA: potassium channel family protein [Dongiaceae bacterium]|nr:potassium channel family protein [Dongiaceae bacterium]
MDSSSGKLGVLLRNYLQSRYKILFYTLLLTFVLSPVLHSLHLSGTLMELLLAASLLVAILPVSAVRTRPSLLAAMFVVWLARPVSDLLDHRLLSTITLGIWAFIGLLAAAAALRFAMSATQVDAEHLYAALSAYLLAGIYLGLLFWLFEQLSPGTFAVTGEFSQTSAIYFSFVTLATLGYGDIAPRADLARGLAIIEGVGGQLFLAVLVARLVSLYSKPGKQSD